MGILYSLPLNDFITLRGGIGGRCRYWCGHHYYPAGPQSLTGAVVRYCLSVADVSPWEGGRGYHRSPRVKTIGSKTATRQPGRTPRNTSQTMEKEETL